MTVLSNYGSTWTFNAATVGKCKVIGFPEISTDEIDVTNHASGGVGESIPSGVVRIGDLTMSVLSESGVLSTLRTAMSNKTIATSIIANNSDTLTGSSWIKSIKVEDADAESPDANKLTVVVACTGAWT